MSIGKLNIRSRIERSSSNPAADKESFLARIVIARGNYLYCISKSHQGFLLVVAGITGLSLQALIFQI